MTYHRRHARLGNPKIILCLSHKDIHASRCTKESHLRELSSKVLNAHRRDDCRLGFPRRFGRFGQEQRRKGGKLTHHVRRLHPEEWYRMKGIFFLSLLEYIAIYLSTYLPTYISSSITTALSSRDCRGDPKPAR